MNMKNIFGVVTDAVTGLAGVLAGFVSLGVLSVIVFGAGTLGINVIGNISNIVSSFLGGGLTGLLTLIVLCGLWSDK